MPKDPICGMDVNPNTHLKLEHNGNTHYFCSEHCLKKFAKENKIGDEELNLCLTCKIPSKNWYTDKTIFILFVLVSLCVVSYFIPILVPFRKSLYMYSKTIWWALLIGFILGGIIDYFIPREYISKVLARKRKRTILYSVILGFFMSACSHGILALSIQLHKKGASVPSVISFLLASPWANMTFTIMLIGFFGVVRAGYIILSAIIIAIITGLIFQLLDRKKLIEHNKNTIDVHEDFSIIKDIKRRYIEYKFSVNEVIVDVKGVLDGSIALADMVLWWLLIGMGIAAVIGGYVPSNIFKIYLGPSFMGLFITLGFATVIEVCSEGSIPIAFEIFRNTSALGNAFVFLMAGVVTDYTEIGLLWTNVGKKTAIWLPLITVPQVILFALIANKIF